MLSKKNAQSAGFRSAIVFDDKDNRNLIYSKVFSFSLIKLIYPIPPESYPTIDFSVFWRNYVVGPIN